jgi:pimeloyl-ACP methyl ester carboxylesterase
VAVTCERDVKSGSFIGETSRLAHMMRYPSGMMLQTTVLATSRVGEPRSFFRVVDGVKLHWLEYGVQSLKTPVVLLHGLNDSHLAWRQIAPELARDRRVFALDLPGHGLSDRPDAGYELAWYTRLVASWIEASGLSQVDIVGHSLGGGIALMLLRVCRPRIRRLVLAAPGGLGKEIGLGLRIASLPGVAGIVERIGQPFMALGTWLARSRRRARVPRRHLYAMSAMNARRGTARAFARTVRDLMNWSGQRHSFFLHAHEIEKLPPITVLWGDRDVIVPMAHGMALARRVEGVRFEQIAGCGHDLQLESPGSFCQAVLRALDASFWPPMRLRAASAAPGLAERSPDSPGSCLAPASS